MLSQIRRTVLQCLMLLRSTTVKQPKREHANLFCNLSSLCHL